MIKVENFVISNLGKILVSEYLMEKILREEKYQIEDEYGVDSNMVCQYACDYLGFDNLGEFYDLEGFDSGFIFVANKEDLDKHIYEKHFNK